MSKLSMAWNNKTKTANGATTFESTLNPLLENIDTSSIVKTFTF